MTSAKPRFHELDLLRFIAAFAVMMFHYSFRGAAADHLSPLPDFSIAAVTRYGFLGVNLFFLISGFVILMSAASGSTRQFVISRVVRLYPAFWICCTITFIVLRLAPHPRFVPTYGQWAASMTMLAGFFTGDESIYIDSVYWSLTIEIQFYAMVYLVLWARWIQRAEMLLGVWLAVYVVAVAFHIRYLLLLLIPQFAPYFVAGAMFFLIARDGVSLYKLGVVAVTYAVNALTLLRGLPDLRAHYHAEFSSVVMLVTLAAFYVIFFLVATGRARLPASKRWLALGALTYPLYLVHQNIGFAIANSAWPRLDANLILWGTVATMLIAAHLVVRVERVTAKPMKELLLRIGSRRPEDALAPVLVAERALGHVEHRAAQPQDRGDAPR